MLSAALLRLYNLAWLLTRPLACLRAIVAGLEARRTCSALSGGEVCPPKMHKWMRGKCACTRAYAISTPAAPSLRDQALTVPSSRDAHAVVDAAATLVALGIGRARAWSARDVNGEHLISGISLRSPKPDHCARNTALSLPTSWICPDISAAAVAAVMAAHPCHTCQNCAAITRPILYMWLGCGQLQRTIYHRGNLLA
ncbi:hypothetical protein C8J57DRAFT_1724945 [Mycena rebaudengoi]|nr:hypothetical protein C8J57DRAFT_1724945 [Mycena rebaudengoi]